MQQTSFGGDKKIGASLLTPLEQRFIRWAVPRVPFWLRSHHLTLTSIPISLLIVAFSYIAKSDIRWLWMVSALVALQWLTDSLDGAVGRARNEGLVRWGYYMDHLLDYVFLAAILIGYMLLLPDHIKELHFFVLAIFGAFMVNSYLAFAATNQFQIAHLGIGPTEVRLMFIAINTLLIIFGKTYLSHATTYILAFSFFGLAVVVYRTQKVIWEIDMKNKAKTENV